MDCFGISDRGLQRKVNEDQFLVAELARSMLVQQTTLPEAGHRVLGGARGTLLVVADGMGGMGGGAVASSVAVDAIVGYVLDVMPWLFRVGHAGEKELEKELGAMVARCQARVKEAAAADPQHPRMGTTLTIAYVLWPRAFLVHVGDTRCYLFRGGRLVQVTRDQTVAQRLADDAVITAEQAETSRWKDVLWSSIGGGSEEFSPEVYRIGLEEGDALLMCTDGLNKHVADDRIAAALAGGGSAEEVARGLVEQAKAGGGSDNVTVVAARFVGLSAVAPEAGEAVRVSERPPERAAPAAAAPRTGRSLSLLGLALVALLAGGAYVAGLWPERQRRAALEGRQQELEARVSAAEGRARLGDQLGRLLALMETVERQDYGIARGEASRFFDALEGETRRAQGETRTALEAALAERDAVVSALATGDPRARERLRTVLLRLRAGLGLPTPPPPPPVRALPAPRTLVDPQAAPSLAPRPAPTPSPTGSQSRPGRIG